MVSKLVYIATDRNRFLRRIHFIIILDYFVRLLRILKSEQSHVDVRDLRKLLRLNVEIPFAVLCRFIVRQSIRAALLVRKMIQPDTWHSLHAELLRGEESAMSFYDYIVSPQSDGIAEPERLDAFGDRVDVKLLMLSRIVFVRF